MQLVVNGEKREFSDGLTVSGLLEALEIPSLKVAVELNREIVVKSTYADTILVDGDTVEIVKFVGGG